jgi:hypothetical protein
VKLFYKIWWNMQNILEGNFRETRTDVIEYTLQSNKDCFF